MWPQLWVMWSTSWLTITCNVIRKHKDIVKEHAYTLEGGTNYWIANATQIFCVCIPWSSCHTCLGQTWWSRASCHESQPERQRATSKETIGHSGSWPDFMVSHDANDENWGLRGWEWGYTSLALIPDRGHRNGTTAWCTHHHMSKCSESSLHIYTEMRPLCVVSWLRSNDYITVEILTVLQKFPDLQI